MLLERRDEVWQETSIHTLVSLRPPNYTRYPHSSDLATTLSKLALTLLFLSVPTTLCSPAAFNTTFSPSITSVGQNNARQIGLAFSTTKDYVEIPGQVFARDYLSSVWSRRGARACDETPVQLNDGERSPGCTISFQCHGNSKDEWVATNGLAQTLVDIVAMQEGIHEHTSRQEKFCEEGCEDNRGSGKCCVWGHRTRWTTKMAKTVAIYARNVDEESDYGEMRYTLTCPVKENSLCRVAKVFANALSAVAPGMGDALSGVAKAFSAVSAIITGTTSIAC